MNLLTGVLGAIADWWYRGRVVVVKELLGHESTGDRFHARERETKHPPNDCLALTMKLQLALPTCS